MATPLGSERTCATCGVSYPPDALFCPTDGTALASPVVPLVGRTIGGRYSVTRELGRGGMGQVYLATQLPMKRPCALKVIRPDRGWDPVSVARFHREAENAARISHPNVAQVYDSGEADGIAFLAMEYVEGEPLADLLEREGKLGPRRTARIIWQVADALGAAHELGIVHRDLKPENVMLTRYRDRADFVKVVDFGIAKAPIDGQQVTSASVVMGTPEYMSPEQFLGGGVNARSDVYSLALLTIRTLAGTVPPIVGPKALMQPPGIADPVELRTMPATAKWPAAVFAALSRALTRDPSARTATVEQFAGEFVQAIAAWEAADGSPEPWDGRLGSLSQPVVRSSAKGDRRVRMVAGAAVVGVVAMGAWLWSRRAATAAPPHPVPVALPSVPPSSPVESLSPQLPPARPPSPVPAMSDADSLALLDRLTDPSRVTAASARRALAMYRALASQFATPAARGTAAYFAGRGLVHLGREAEACALFRGAARDVGISTMTEPIRVLLEGCRAR